MTINRDSAHALLCEYTLSPSLRGHAYAVEAAMLHYADIYSEDPVIWGITGLLHDFDYERWPEPTPPDGHPYRGCAMLSELGYPEEIITAIMGHAHYTDTPRETLLAKALFACDELSGLITAASLVRPDRSILNLGADSVLRKMKDKAFARAVSRDDIRLGAESLGLELRVHVENVLTGMQKCADRIT